MLRFLILASALSLLLLIGFIAMDKGSVNKDSVTETTGTIELSRKKDREDTVEAANHRSKVDTVFEKSKDVVRSIFEGTKTRIEEMTQPSQKESAKKENSIETGIVKRPEVTESIDVGKTTAYRKDRRDLQQESLQEPEIDKETVMPSSDKNDRPDDMAERWVVLEETQQILFNTGEILK